jgi:hypothetical protein
MMHHEDRDAHQWMVGGFDNDLEGLTFHPPTINEMLEARRQREIRNKRADNIVAGICAVVLIAVVCIVLLT